MVSFAFVTGIKKRCDNWQQQILHSQLISTFCRQLMPPKLNIQLSWKKKNSIEENKSSSFEIKCRTAKLVTVQEI